MYDHLVLSIGKIVGDIGGMQEIVRKILLDDVLLVARTDD